MGFHFKGKININVILFQPTFDIINMFDQIFTGFDASCLRNVDEKILCSSTKSRKKEKKHLETIQIYIEIEYF